MCACDASQKKMSTLLNVGVFLGGYCAISATAAASIWAIKRDVRLPEKDSISLPQRPRAAIKIRKIRLTAPANTQYSTS